MKLREKTSVLYQKAFCCLQIVFDKQLLISKYLFKEIVGTLAPIKVEEGCEVTPPMTGDLARSGAIAPSPSMDSNITLWQFLLEMLNKNEFPHLIKWSSNDGEFKVCLK